MTRRMLTGWLAVAMCVAMGSPSIAGDDPPDRETREAIAQARVLSKAFQYAAREVEPAVVHIQSFANVRMVDWFGRPIRQRESGLQPTGLGSGVIVSNDGLILTNYHVIEGAAKLEVRLADGRTYEARVIGADEATDLGVLRIAAEELPHAEFGDSDALEVGEWVVAIGSPFGFDNSVTAGIVSAKGRGLTPDRYGRYEDFIQTDAAINRGNSGGPLINLEGRVVGINSQIATPSGGSVGIGFAIPAAMARQVMDSILKNGRVIRGWLGVEMADLTPQIAQQAGLVAVEGVVVSDVVPGSPAEAAGLRIGDVITRFNDRPINDRRRLRTTIALTPPGTRVNLEAVRGGERVSLPAVVGDQSSNLVAALEQGNTSGLGLTLKSVTPEMAREMGFRSLSGALITAVAPESIAAATGFEPGYVIVRVGRYEVSSAEECTKRLADSDLEQGVRVYVVTPDGERGFLPLRLVR